MKRKGLGHLDSNLAKALDLLGERWTLLVVQSLVDGHQRFETIRDQLGIARNILASRLNGLVEAGVVERRPYSERPLRHEYHLTTMGRDLVTPLDHLSEWGEKWL